MAKKAKKAKQRKARTATKKSTRKAGRKPVVRTAATRRVDALLAPIKGATMREIGGVLLEVVPAGQARV